MSAAHPRTRRWYVRTSVVLVACAMTQTCNSVGTTSPTAPSVVAPMQSASPQVLVGAGDIMNCDSVSLADETAKLALRLGAPVFTAGDNVYMNGTPEEFACYDRYWGRFRDKTYPSPGNHDYNTPGATGYYAYFGNRAGPSNRGYYSYELGSWHVVSLNSNIDASASSAQATWLSQDLDANKQECIFAYWHHPLFSSDNIFDGSDMRPIWRILYEHHAAVVVNGHYHAYERFSPQAPDGRFDANGIREFIVGTGGTFLVPRRTMAVNSEVFDATSHGLIKFVLFDSSYSWEFLRTDGAFSDSGTASCPSQSRIGR